MGMKDMAASLAGLDEDTRRTMLGTRLQGFAAMPYEERVRAMAEMLGGIHSLSDADRRTLVASRTWALSQLPHDTQVTLMRSHLAARSGVAPARAAPARDRGHAGRDGGPERRRQAEGHGGHAGGPGTMTRAPEITVMPPAQRPSRRQRSRRRDAGVR